ncbi:MAG: hypothetical protein R3F19_28000 [Verrucomicrobiales bacterium]
MENSNLSRLERRSAFLRKIGVDEALLSEMLSYCDPLIADGVEIAVTDSPPEDEPFAEAWEKYVLEAEKEGAWAVLSRYLMQLSFPIDASIAESAEYAAATRRGVRPLAPVHPPVNDPDGISICLHPSVAGRIPVISIADRRDFVTIVQALLRKNRPDPVPDSMGASMVAGYTNWERIERYRKAWEEKNPFGDWNAAFKELAQQKPLYQDRFILLSGGDYSGIPAGAAGVAESEWKQISINLRREHECVHYFTRRVLGSMRNSLLDELVADAMAVRAVAGHLREDWLALFFGIEDWPSYREGGRLENYVPANLEGCFEILTRMMHEAIANVVAAEKAAPASISELVFIRALCSCGLDELACPDGSQLLQSAASRIDPKKSSL